MNKDEIVTRIRDWCKKIPVFGVDFPSRIEHYKPGDTAYELQSVALTADRLIRVELVYPHSEQMLESGLMNRIIGFTLTFSGAQDVVDEVLYSSNEVTEGSNSLPRRRIYRSKILRFLECQNLMIDNLVPEADIIGPTFYENASMSFGHGESDVFS